MGIRMRKSINLGGGFRINLSKSGVGYSWGVPGYRITKTATGQTRKTYSIPGTGVSYNETVPKKKKPSAQQNISPIDQNVVDQQEIQSGDISNFKSAEYREMLQRLSKIILYNRTTTFLIIFIFLFPDNPFFVVGFIGIFLKIFVRTKLPITFIYEMDDASQADYKKRITAWRHLASAKGLWQIVQSGTVINKKVEAGASRKIRRQKFSISSKLPYYIKSNVDVVMLKLRKEKLLLLPDKILIIRGRKIGAESYENLNIDVHPQRFIEEDAVPKDTKIVGQTWKYVNKNGTADKRFKNNRQLPICLYGEITLTSASGINVMIHCSNLELAEGLQK